MTDGSRSKTPVAPADGRPEINRTRRKRRPHAAATTRVLTAGLATTAAFGMVATMGLANPPEATATAPVAAPTTTTTAPPPPEPRQIIIVRPRYIPVPSGSSSGGSSSGGSSSGGSSASASSGGSYSAPAPAPAPVPAPAPAPAPVTSSGGS